MHYHWTRTFANKGLVDTDPLPPAKAVKKIDKDRFFSISSILSIIDKNFNLSIVMDFYQFFENSPIFPKKTTFLEKMGEKFLGNMTIF